MSLIIRPRLIAAVSTAALGASATLLWATHPTPQPGTPADAHTSLQTIEIRPVAATGPAGTPTTEPGVPARGTGPFSLLGVTWSDPTTRLAGTVQVRTRDAGTHRWSDWRALEVDAPNEADPGEGEAVRGSTDPLWVGPSDGVEARILNPDGRRSALPEGLRVDLIDPGDAPTPRPTPAAYTAAYTATLPASSAAAAAPPDDAAAGATTAGTAASTTATTAGPRAAAVTLPARPVPRAVSRARWGADESLVKHDPAYTSDVQALFVHHTAGSNAYDCADSPRIIRSIQAYHVRSRHWNDIGYNFLVDRCGTLFEGRRGGVTRPVLGAHTLGFNSHAAGIAVLGSYENRGIPKAVRMVIAQVAAYKIGMYGNDPSGRVTLTSGGSGKYPAGRDVRLNRISGHRNVVPTDCPGDTLYGQLADIRDLVTDPVKGLGISRLTGALRSGTVFATKGPVVVGWGIRTATALLSRFEILVDGQLTAAAPAGARAAKLHLAPGQHTIRVRAVPLAGSASTSVAWHVLADPTDPTFSTSPAVGLRTGSLDGSVPVTLRWQASDAGGLRQVRLTQPTTRDLGTGTTRWPTTARPARTNTWRVVAVDRAGNATSAAVSRRPTVLSETAATRTGSWGVRRSTGFLSGTALLASAAGTRLTWSFTGRSAALAFTRTARSGKVQVIVDGTPAGTLDLRSATPAHRRAVFARSWSVSGPHTVSIVVAGTAGRPDVISDGLVYLP